MKHAIIFSTFAFILFAATFGTAQVSSVRVTFSESANPTGGGGMGKVSFQDLHVTTSLKVFEALVPATTVEQCYASRDFSTARPVGPDRASLAYDTSTNTLHLKWLIGKETRDSCRVILIGDTVDSADLNVWRASFGQTAFAAEDFKMDDETGVRTGDGSVRSVSYQIGVNGWH